MGKKLTLALFMAILGALVCPSPSQAQRGFLMGRGQAVRARPHVPLGPAHQGGYLRGTRGHHRQFNNGYLPYLYPYYYPDYYPEEAPTETQPSQVIVVERNQPRAEAPPPAPPPDSLMLELRGNHWVRVTDSGQIMTESQAGKKGSTKTGNVRTITPEEEQAAVEPARELPPAVLVFRDGHREEISRYTIVGDAIYTSADYWNGGPWTKKVPIAELNVPATLELNRERGANFSLPSSPHVVVIRP